MDSICDFPLEILAAIFKMVYDDATGNGRWVGASVCRRIRMVTPPSTLILSYWPHYDHPADVRYIIRDRELQSFLHDVQLFADNRSPFYKVVGPWFGHIRAAKIDVRFCHHSHCHPKQDRAIAVVSQLHVKSIQTNGYYMDEHYIRLLKGIGESCEEVNALTLVIESARTAMGFPYAECVAERTPEHPGCRCKHPCTCSELDLDDSRGSDATDGGDPEINEKATVPRFVLSEDTKGLANALMNFANTRRLVIDCPSRQWSGLLVKEETQVDLLELLPRLEFYSFRGPHHLFFHNYSS
ncbi:hypothetical protein EST38_g13257 [Candolleomyces aberdarensis]|uniref:Uncharacterized protein n=1 Tax=Candolleomyces aberdarensis TaxID=2316362 RepID=A0A4V1Q1S4_9AGAR|nr:hypothetical protein EST38_g13257 [Candolleomyces aberdarensis]